MYYYVTLAHVQIPYQVEATPHHMSPPHLQSSTIKSLGDLKPLFAALASSERSEFTKEHGIVDKLETLLLNDFIER